MHSPVAGERSDAFWLESYRGHTIAALNHGQGWLVYLDHVLQHNKLFATAEAAATWLRCRIDAAVAGDAGLAPRGMTSTTAPRQRGSG